MNKQRTIKLLAEAFNRLMKLIENTKEPACGEQFSTDQKDCTDPKDETLRNLPSSIDR